MRGSNTIALLLASLALTSPQLARAQPPRPSAKDLQTASELVKKAIARSQAGDHAAAIEIYLQANSLAPNTLLLSNIGWEYQQDGSLEEALTYFCMYLDKDPTGTNAPYARAQAKIVQRKLGNKNLDDDTVCSTPAKAPAKAEPVQSQAPSTRDPAPPRDTPKDAESRHSRTLLYSGVVTGGLGVLATGISVYYGIKGQHLSDYVDSHKPAPGEPWYNGIRDDQAEGDHDNRMQIGFLIAGGALLVGGAIMTWVGWPDDVHRSERDDRAIRVTPTRNGLAVFGKF